MANRFQTHNGAIPNRPSSFADDILQLFGSDFDPDPLFLEESWTLGVPTAAENLHRRRQNPTDRERQSRAFRELNNLGLLIFIEDHDGQAESLLADRADMIASRYALTWSQRPAQTNDAPTRDIQQSWSPAGWIPDDEIAHRWSPRGWVSECVPRLDAALHEVESLAQPWNNMAVGQAHQLLGTTTTSTREQIRSAYRRKVSEWHPDRLQYVSEAVRECATQQMAAINEAYRLLRTVLLQDAA
jgi:hypothetical protein